MRIHRVLLLFVATAAGLTAFAWFRFVRVPEITEPPLSGSLTRESIELGGRERTFLYYAPQRLAPHPALVFILHGSMGDGAQARAMMSYEFDMLADLDGFVAVYPDGWERHWNGCRQKGPYAANELDIDDVGFLSALIDWFVAAHGADRTRVFATGVSNGGQMALRLALEAPDRVRAIAPIVASLPSGENFGCGRKEVPVSILLMNGTEDPMNPDAGGTVAFYGIFGNRGTVHSTRETIEYWKRLAGHTAAPEQFTLLDRVPDDDSVVDVTRWRAPGKPEVVLYSIRGGGHTVPHPRGRMPRMLGPTNADINAGREIWEFFERNGT